MGCFRRLLLLACHYPYFAKITYAQFYTQLKPATLKVDIINPSVTFVNAVIVTKADPVRPQHALADADSGHGRWVDNMCESAFAAAHRAKGFTIAASRNVTLGLINCRIMT
jgi:hypothetical protein